MRKFRICLPTIFLSVFMLLATIAGSAHAQNESSAAAEAEVPQALGPDAMKSLVSKLNENQTAALVELMQLLSAPAGKDEVSAVAQGPGGAEIVKQWFTDFGANLKTQLLSFPQMLASVGKSIRTALDGREAGGTDARWAVISHFCCYSWLRSLSE